MADAHNPVQFFNTTWNNFLIKGIAVCDVQAVNGCADSYGGQFLQNEAYGRKKAVTQVNMVNGIFWDDIKGFNKA